MKSIDTSWRFTASSVDGKSLLINGIDVWKHEWQDTKERVVVTDPKYHQEFTFYVYQIQHEGWTLRFAAGEFSNCVWGFYLQS